MNLGLFSFAGFNNFEAITFFLGGGNQFEGLGQLFIESTR